MYKLKVELMRRGYLAIHAKFRRDSEKHYTEHSVHTASDRACYGVFGFFGPMHQLFFKKNMARKRQTFLKAHTLDLPLKNPRKSDR